MNEKNDLLLIEAMDLTRASGMIDLLRAEERREEAWTVPLETAAERLADAHKRLEALSVMPRSRTQRPLDPNPLRPQLARSG